MEREDGEMSDDNAMLVDEDSLEKYNVPTDGPETVLHKAKNEGLVIKQLDKVDAAKLGERAQRFGLNLTGNRVITQAQIDELYANFGIESGNERHFRLEAIYLNGIDGLTTPEIFEYLEDYKPSYLEWIDDMSCNVVCQDHISAALALLLHSREIKSHDLKEMLAEKSSHHWREGVPHPKKELILMRFATNGEKKKLTKKPDPRIIDGYYNQSIESVIKNPWGDLCSSWGVYDHQEIFSRKLPKIDYEDDIEEEPKPAPIHVRNKKLAMRLGIRKTDIENNSEDSSSDSEWKSKSKTPRMRMHADDEECKLKKVQANTINNVIKLHQIHREKYAPLSIEVLNCRNEYIKKESTRVSDKFKFHGGKNQNINKSGLSSIRSRLGDKVTQKTLPNDKSSQSEGSSDELSSNEGYDVNITSKVQKVSSDITDSSVWSRLDNNGYNSGAKSDLRQILKSKITKKTNDLRSRLGKLKHANLRIEIDNHHTSK